MSQQLNNLISLGNIETMSNTNLQENSSDIDTSSEEKVWELNLKHKKYKMIALCDVVKFKLESVDNNVLITNPTQAVFINYIYNNTIFSYLNILISNSLNRQENKETKLLLKNQEKYKKIYMSTLNNSSNLCLLKPSLFIFLKLGLLDSNSVRYVGFGCRSSFLAKASGSSDEVGSDEVLSDVMFRPNVFEVGSVAPAQQPGSFPPAQQPGSFPPAQQLGSVPSAQQPGSVLPAQQPGSFAPAQQPGSVPSAQQLGLVPPAQKVSSSSLEAISVVPPEQYLSSGLLEGSRVVPPSQETLNLLKVRGLMDNTYSSTLIGSSVYCFKSELLYRNGLIRDILGSSPAGRKRRSRGVNWF